MLYRAPMSDADLLKPPETSPFRERFDIDRVKRLLVASGEFNEKQAHHIAHDLYEIDESYERMFYALRRGILPKLEAGDVDGAMEALAQYEVWLFHLLGHAETFQQATDGEENEGAIPDGAV